MVHTHATPRTARLVRLGTSSTSLALRAQHRIAGNPPPLRFRADGVVAGAENRRRCPPCGDVCAGTRHDRFVRTTPKLADIGTCRDLGKAENSPSTKIRLSRMKAGSRINVKNDKCAQAISTNPTMRRVTRCALRPRLVSCAIAPHHPVRADRTPAAGAHWARAHRQVASSRQSSPTAGLCLRHPPG